MNIVFLSGLDVHRLDDGTRRLNKALTVNVDSELYRVPIGFITDYSSIPQAFAWIVRWDKIDLAGVIHDFLYQKQFVTRSIADSIWRKIAQSGANRTNFVQAWVCWFGLRIGAWLVWNRYAKAKNKEIKV